MSLSPWHLLGLGLVALLGTGILAAIDRSQERASSHSVRSQPPKSEPRMERAVVDRPYSANVASPGAFASPDLPIGSDMAAAPDVTSDPGRESRSSFVAPAQAAAAETPPRAAPPPTVVESAIERRGQPVGEGPFATASLTPAVVPAQPPSTVGLQSAVTRGTLKTSAAAPTDCLPHELRAVLSDVAARFGTITVVSTHELTTGNHSAGSIREKLHHDCKAVDIRAERGRIDEIKTYLHGRREIVGLESYRNGVIHMDVSGGIVASARSQARTARRVPEATMSEALQAPAAPPPAATPAPPADGAN